MGVLQQKLIHTLTITNENDNKKTCFLGTKYEQEFELIVKV